VCITLSVNVTNSSNNLPEEQSCFLLSKLVFSHNVIKQFTLWTILKYFSYSSIYIWSDSFVTFNKDVINIKIMET